MGRSPCCDENVLKKGPWTSEEDKKLVQYIQKHGHGSWRALPKLSGLNRCGKSCRLRWTNYLRPDIKRGKFSTEEEQTILNLHSLLGNKWSAIATHLPGRTDNEIKNFWNTHLKKKLIKMGFDPMTHRPRTDLFSTLPQLIALANLKQAIEQCQSFSQEDALRLHEVLQVTKLQYLQNLLQLATEINSSSSTTSPRTTLEEMEAFNTWNSTQSSPKESLGLNFAGVESAAPQAARSDQMAPNYDASPSHELPLSCNFHASVSDEIKQDSSFAPFRQQECYRPQSPAADSSTPVQFEENSITNPSDACSTSGYGVAAPFWPELFLDDPFFS